MNKLQLIALVVAVALSLAMLLYPPYMVSLTGSHLGYYFAFNRPGMVDAFGTLNTGRLLLQLLAVWAVAVMAAIALRRSQP